MDLSERRVYYIHDANCSGDNFSETSEQTGLKQCLDCAGVFDQEDKGVAITSKKFDAPID